MRSNKCNSVSKKEGLIIILSLIAEATECDFKIAVERDKPISWLKSVSAFANGAGGTLFFGVGNDGSAIGLTDTQSDAEFISNRIKERINPLPVFVLSPYTENGRDILALVVKTGRNAPYYYYTQGVKQAYVRIGNESVPAPDYILNELILKGSNRTNDTLTTDKRKSDYSFTLLEATYLQRAKLRFELTDYISFGLESSDGFLTRAGSLFTDQHIVYNSRLFCTRWNGLTMGSIFDDALDDKEFEGNLIYLLSNGLDFVRNNTKVRFVKKAIERIDKPDYAERAVTEVLVNALIHRDYLIQGSEIHIDIYDDRLEISSPGGMYSGKTVQEQDINSITSERRNPVIADLFHRMKYMERRGSGLNKIINETKKLPGYNDAYRPEFFSTFSSFTVRLKNVNYFSDKKDGSIDTFGKDREQFGKEFGKEFGKDQEQFGKDNNLKEIHISILRVLASNPTTTTQFLASELKMTQRNIEKHIRLLKKAGLLEREGGRKDGRWSVKHP